MSNRTEYEFPPTPGEASLAMKQQCLALLRFHFDRKMSVSELNDQIKEALAILKSSSQTEKYTLKELGDLCQVTDNSRITKLYEHESQHAKQMERVIQKMGINTKPEFDVYYCPILADMYQAGNAIGLIEISNSSDFNFNRQQTIRFNLLFTVEMLKSGKFSSGDLFIAIGILGGNILSVFH